MATRSKGDGSIYQRADGKWVGSLEAGWRDGRRRRRTVTGDTRARVVQRMRALRAEVDAGVLAENITVEKWITYWLDEVCELKPSTMYTYRNYVKTWIIPAIGKIELRKLRPEHVRRLQRKMAEAGKAPTTIRQMHAILSKALTVAREDRRIVENVAELAKVKVPADGAKHASLTEVEAIRVLRTAELSGDRRELARLVCALVLGMRQGEVLGLQWEDVDLDAGLLRIHDALHNVPGTGGPALGTVKSKKSKRTVPLPLPVVDILAAWKAKATSTTWVFPNNRGKPLDKRRDARDWSASLAAAGIGHVPLHGARSSAASVLAAMGVPDRVIADILGHENVTTTQRHYIRAEGGHLVAALDGAAALMLPKPQQAPATRDA